MKNLEAVLDVSFLMTDGSFAADQLEGAKAMAVARSALLEFICDKEKHGAVERLRAIELLIATARAP